MSVVPGLGVYVNSETIPPYLAQLGIDVNKPQSIAAYHTPFPYNQIWLNDLNERYDSTDRIIVFCSELHEVTVTDLITLDRSKIELHLCGVINYNFKQAQVYRWMDWFHTSTAFYRQHNILDLLTPYEVKPKSFDILLGCRRLNRDLVYNYINEHKLNVVMTYFRLCNIDLRTTDQFIPEETGLEYIETPEHTVHQVRYHGYRMCLSQVVPVNIYNQTAYTLVTETNGLNHFNFYTEKIVKPILARRLFVVIAGQYYLRNLRAMGFKTFDGIIDETYDSVEDSNTRWMLALEQVRLLCEKPQAEILAAVKLIVEHNRQRMLEPDWQLVDYAKVSPLSIS
jgi:hypothetical protein